MNIVSIIDARFSQLLISYVTNDSPSCNALMILQLYKKNGERNSAHSSSPPFAPPLAFIDACGCEPILESIVVKILPTCLFGEHNYQGHSVGLIKVMCQLLISEAN